MKSVLNWTKSNPISVASIFIVITSCVIFYMFAIQGGADVRKRANEWNKRLSEVDRFMRASVVIPSPVSGESEQISPITINGKVIDKIRNIYSKINDSYDSLYQETVARSKENHELLIPEIFDPKMKDNRDLPFKFRTKYKQAFIDLLAPFDPAIGIPQLNAGLPPSANDQAMAIKEAQENYIASVEVARGTGGAGTLTSEDQEKIVAAQRERLLEMLQNQALNINVYASTNFNSPLFPFQIGSWALDTSGRSPEPFELYEGQMELWIQQDIASAIAKANGIYQMDTQGNFLRDSQGNLMLDDNNSVLNAPFKNLKVVEIVSGYVGIQSRGGITGDSNKRSNAGGRGQTPRRSVIAYSPPAEMMDDNPDQKIKENFYISPTGRASNAVYDVRHVRIVADVDYQELPEIFDAFNKVNFMTVVDCQISQIDEYELLAQGYMYGSSDCVQIEMVVESVWLRELTREYMPNTTLEYLGLKEPSNPDAAGRGMMFGPGMF
ncbi:hypothetical protein KS4_14480 [Poriferisphaera corsica]|uniref:Uncharacterized protein n=1 Tax=Poriferisphaera corsica TaxID=2528020 RepID=A0A517YTC3_9BACT|nr:hypothetical protein [Poriferisphaera corsica]QDU33402.1 hypothetical protein KS4_14480 [Poriferisphaera corsica]